MAKRVFLYTEDVPAKGTVRGQAFGTTYLVPAGQEVEVFDVQYPDPSYPVDMGKDAVGQPRQRPTLKVDAETVAKTICHDANSVAVNGTLKYRVEG